MHTIELMEQAMSAAEALGYGLRQEYLGGVGGGGCEIAGKKWLFIDLALTSPEQLAQLLDALRADPGIHELDLPSPLAQAVGTRQAA